MSGNTSPLNSPYIQEKSLSSPAVGLGSFSRESLGESLDGGNYANSTNLETTAKMSSTQDMVTDSLALHHAKNNVDNLISMSPPVEFEVTNEELKEIQEKFIYFSNMVLTFSIKCSSEQITVAWWQEVEQDLLVKVIDHKKQVRVSVSGRQVSEQNNCQKRYFEISDFPMEDEHSNVSTKGDGDSDVAATVVEDCNVSTKEEEKSDVPTNKDMIHNQSCQIDLDVSRLA